MTTETRMSEQPWPVRIADGCATDASLAHATAVGLYEVIDRFRFADPAHPIPAPGLADLPDEVHRHALAAIQAAASARILAEQPEHSEPGDPALDQAVARAQDAGLAAQRGLRRIAQIGLGVAQHSDDGDEVELLERTLIGVLVHDTADVPAARDAFPIVGRTRAEVSVELAGLIARMICEDPRPPAAVHPAGFVVIADGADDVVVAVTPGGGVAVDDVDFAPPVIITEVTALICSRIAALDPSAVGRVAVEWRAP